MEVGKEIQFLMYSTPQEDVKVDVIVKGETIWLTQKAMSILFGTQRPAITKHLNNIYNSGELDEKHTSSILEHMGNDDKQKYQTKYYNLDAIISVGYRVNSARATQFRIWATQIIKDYMLKGYAVNQRFENLESRMSETEKKIDFFVKTSLLPIQGIFFDGQIFDAYAFVNKIIKSAKKSIVLIDNYIDEAVLTMFSEKSENVKVVILTKEIKPKLSLDIAKFNEQYKNIEAKIFNISHDRFLIIDNKEIYHLGASLKDLGRKIFAFQKMEDGISLLEKIENL